MKPEYIEEELRIAHSENGDCGSCSWHAAFYEMEYEFTNNSEAINEHWDSCKRGENDGGDTSDHRGCYIYPVKL